MAGTKISKSELEGRVEQCYKLRYETQPSIYFRDWIKYCHENYNDKSEQQYTQYWSKASEQYNETWKEKLNKMLDPAMNELISLLGSEDEKIRQRAIDQIVKYTGNDVQQIEAKIEGNIQLNWGDSIFGSDPGDEQNEDI
jgi:hypothetical protein